MDKNLLVQALVKVIVGFVIMSLLLFVSAGTIGFWQGWLLLAILFIPMIAAGLIMYFNNPALLEKRLNAKEKEPAQKLVLVLSGIMFIVSFIVAGLNIRFEWAVFRDWVSYIAAAVFLFGYGMFAEVIRENEYLSRTIEIQKNQEVVETGLYSVVRHPMYLATLILFLAMPVVLGSFFSFLITLLYIPIICIRINNEEQVLTEGLKGYKEYKRRVRFRIIPFIW